MSALFDPANEVVRLCSEGMLFEGEGRMAEAAENFTRAWGIAVTDLEKFIAAHYVARHQASTADKLHWDQAALEYATKVENPEVKGNFSSLHLNIAKGYEDLGENESAATHYREAAFFLDFLPADGFAAMIKRGIEAGEERIRKRQ